MPGLSTVPGPARDAARRLWTTGAARRCGRASRTRSPALWRGRHGGGRRHTSAERQGPAPAAAFFDLDKTIIAKSSTLAFSKPFQAGGLISRRAVLRSAYAQFVYHVGGADHDQMEKMRQFLSPLCAGWDVQTVREIVAETLHNVVDPLVYEEAVSLIEEHHLAGRDVVIVSASGAEVVEPIGEMLGADQVVATQMEIVDGKYTGEIDYYAYAENKAAAIGRLAGERGYDLARCYAYSDSVTDIHMLEAVGHPFAVNPDRELRRGPSPAAGRCWCSPARWRCAAGCGSREPADAGRARGRRRRGGRRRPPGGPPTARTAVGADRTAESTLVGPRAGVERGAQLTEPHVIPVPTRRTTLPDGLVRGTTRGSS